MSKARDLADSIAEGSVLADGVVSLSEISGGTNNGVLYTTSEGVTHSGSNLTFDGDHLHVSGNVNATTFIGDGSELTGIDALPSQTDNDNKYLKTNGTVATWEELVIPEVPVDSVNGYTGTVVLTASDVGAATASDISTAVTGLASETYVDTAVANLVDSSPATLDTLNELAAALGDDPNFATTVSTNIGTKADKTTLISAGTGLTGGGDLSANRTITHANSTVTAGNYGSSTSIPSITVDARGHVTAASGNAISVGNGSMTVNTGSGLTGGALLGTANQSGNTSVTISHADTSTQSSVNNSDNTFIQDITLDGFGHITGLVSATATDTNNYLSGASFSTSTGVLTLTRSGLSDVTVDLDGKYAESSHSHSYLPLSGGTLTGRTFVSLNERTTSYTGSNFEVITTDNTPPGISFHRGGYSATLIYESDGELYTSPWQARGQTGKLLAAGNFNDYAPTKTGGGASGTWDINITGSANYATTAGSADQIDGWGFVNTGSNSAVNADTIASNGISYYTGGVTNFSGNASDGALYSQYYSSSWQHQIAGDYRSGQIALRGRNSGTWQAWRTVVDSSNVGTYAALPGHTHSNYVTTTYNSSLNSDSRNSRGVTRLYRRDDDSDYSVQTYWTGSYWRLYGYLGDSGHADVQVGYADNTGYATTAGNANALGGLGVSAFMRDDGWNNYPGQDANAQERMRSDFSYSNNAPHTGDLIRFGSDGYSLQLSSAYSGGTGFSFRTRNGDTASWNPWYQILHAGNYSSYAAPAAHDHDRIYLTDSRGAARAPSYYDDRYAQWDFQQQTDTGAGGDVWHGLLTVAKWSSYDPANRQEQLAFTGNDLKRRTASSDSAWGAWKVLLDSTNYTTYAAPISHTHSAYLPLTGGTMSGNIGRTAHNTGYFVGGHNNIGGTSTATSPIYAIGTSYLPAELSLGNMYGIGYSHGNDASFISLSGATGWGLYVAADGDARVYLDAQNGVVVSTGSHRAPIFYDSGNTSYYVDPNSKSELQSLDLGSTTGTVYNTAGQGTLFFNSHNETDIQGYSIGTTLENVGGNYTKLTIDWHTGIRIGAASTYGGIRFYNNSVKHFNGSEVFSIARTDNHVRVGEILYVGASARAPIFYDSNDTTYYVDPNSTSYLYNLILAGGGYFQPNNWIQFNSSYGLYWPNHYGAHLHANDLSTYTQIALRGNKNGYGGIYDQHSAVNIGMYDGSGNGGLYREANGRWYLYHNVSSNCTGFGTSTTNSAYGIYVVKGGYFDGRVDGTIFYDVNNTAYYSDPASTSVVNVLKATTLQNSSGSTIYAAKAWASFESNGTLSILDSGGVSSITDNGVGDFTVNFSTAFPNADYAVVTSSNSNTTANNITLCVKSTLSNPGNTSQSKLTTSVRLQCGLANQGLQADSSGLYFACFTN